MMLFRKNSNPKKLSTREVWRLYQTLRYGVQGSPQEYMMDEVLEVLDKISVEEFKSSLKQMYSEIDFNLSPVELAVMFTRGIKANNLFSFFDFVKVISGSSER